LHQRTVGSGEKLRAYREGERPHSVGEAVWSPAKRARRGEGRARGDHLVERRLQCGCSPCRAREAGKKRKLPFSFIFPFLSFPCFCREMEAYYRRLGADAFNVEVKRIDDQRGKGCFAKTQFEDHDVVFRDRALACLQSRKQTAADDTGFPSFFLLQRFFGWAAPHWSSSASGAALPRYPRPVATCEQCHRYHAHLCQGVHTCCRRSAQ
jgi:hypothetical protein